MNGTFLYMVYGIARKVHVTGGLDGCKTMKQKASVLNCGIVFVYVISHKKSNPWSKDRLQSLWSGAIMPQGKKRN